MTDHEGMSSLEFGSSVTHCQLAMASSNSSVQTTSATFSFPTCLQNLSVCVFNITRSCYKLASMCAHQNVHHVSMKTGKHFTLLNHSSSWVCVWIMCGICVKDICEGQRLWHLWVQVHSGVAGWKCRRNWEKKMPELQRTLKSWLTMERGGRAAPLLPICVWFGNITQIRSYSFVHNFRSLTAVVQVNFETQLTETIISGATPKPAWPGGGGRWLYLTQLSSCIQLWGHTIGMMSTCWSEFRGGPQKWLDGWSLSLMKKEWENWDVLLGEEKAPGKSYRGLSESEGIQGICRGIVYKDKGEWLQTEKADVYIRY